MKYDKTHDDQRREEHDLKTNPIMRWLINGNQFKFNVGDILIKKTKDYPYNSHGIEVEEKWTVEVINKTTGAPRKYIYCFENELGIGYIRQLKVDGSGVCGTLICLINFDSDYTRFELDPEFVDHMLIGQEEFQPNRQYLEKRQFREEAMNKNKGIMLNTTSPKKLWAWYKELKVGDTFYHGETFDEFTTTKYEVTRIVMDKPPVINKHSGNPYGYGNKYESYYGVKLIELASKDWFKIEVKVIQCDPSNYYRKGTKTILDAVTLMNTKVSFQDPFPMKDTLCGPQK